MANEEHIYIEERPDGKYAIRKGNSERASAVEETQEKAIEAAQKMFPGLKTTYRTGSQHRNRPPR